MFPINSGGPVCPILERTNSRMVRGKRVEEGQETLPTHRLRLLPALLVVLLPLFSYILHYHPRFFWERFRMAFKAFLESLFDLVCLLVHIPCKVS